MTAVTVSFDGTRNHDMGDTDGVTGVTNIGGGAGAGVEPDFFYQGSNAVSRKVQGAGFWVNNTAFSPTRPGVFANFAYWFCKVIVTNSGALLGNGAPALEVRAGSGTTVYTSFDIAGNDNYPTRGGFLVFPITKEDNAYWGVNTGGTPSVWNYFAAWADASASSRAENLAMDAIDVGYGLVLSGGGGADPAATFQDFVDEDEGNTSNRWGCALTGDGGVIILQGQTWIGRSTGSPISPATVFTDSFFTVALPLSGFILQTEADIDDYGIGIDLSNSGTTVEMSDGTFLGSDSAATWAAFNTEDDINATNDTIGNATNNLQEEFPVVGWMVRVWNQGGTETPGPTTATLRYYIGHGAAEGTITLHTTRANALTGTSPVALTASTAGNGEEWFLYNRDYSNAVGDTYGVGMSILGGRQFAIRGEGEAGSCTFTRVNFINLTRGYLTSAFTLDTCTVVGGISLINTSLAADPVITDCSFVSIDGAYGRSGDNNTRNQRPDSFLDHFVGLDNITGCTFSSRRGYGHAITIRGETSSPLPSPLDDVYNLVGNTFENYFTAVDQSFHQFNANTDVDGTANTITLPAGHGYTTGDAVVYTRQLSTNGSISGLTTDFVYFVNVKSPNTEMSLHLNRGDALNNNAPISLTAKTDSPAQTHSLWPANAAIFNNTGRDKTINVSGGGTTPSIRNGLDATTTVNNNVSVTITGAVESTEIRVCLTGTQTAVDGIENVGSPTDFTFSVASGVGVDIIIHAIGYEHIRLANLSFTSDTSLPISQRVDRNYSNPDN